MVDAKAETCLNGGSDEGVPISGVHPFETFSGYEAADERNNWDSFKHLVADEESRYDASINKRVPSETCKSVTLMVSVEDTGIEIPLISQHRVFMPFMQADSSTSRNYGGTGIGLSITKCLVELMGGHISFVSRPQVGSTFSFTADFGRCKKAPFSDMKISNTEELPSSFRGLKATVVVGKPVRAAVTRYHLKRFGMLVEVASSVKIEASACGKNGSSCGSKIQPDIILVEKDLWVSDEDGGLSLQMFDRKQNGHVLKLPKMILLATNITNAELEKAKAAGFADTTIMKPMKASMVAACLQQVLGIGKKRQAGKNMLNGSSPLRSLLCGKKILLVDDNMVNRRVAAGALKKFGAVVECAESEKVALKLLQIPHRFDACFMDIQMPEMDGFEATRQIRMMESQTNEEMNRRGSEKGSAQKDEGHVPILAMTSDAMHATYDECLKCGMDGYVSKPFEEENLYQAVAKFFEAKQITDS